MGVLVLDEGSPGSASCRVADDARDHGDGDARRFNCLSTIIWHHIAMPDDHHPIMPRRNPEDIDLAAIKTDLEFLMERVSRLPTRKEQALKPLYMIVGSAGIVIGWIELFWRHCL